MPTNLETKESSSTIKRGWERLIAWQNAAELRRLVYEMCAQFPKDEMRRVSQMRDSARSVKQNIQEGYSRYSIGEYIHALNIAQGSLGELMGDIQDCLEDRLITLEQFKRLDPLCGKTQYILKRLMQSLRLKRQQQDWPKS